MEIIDFRKETSERSKTQNWVFDEISTSKLYYYAGFEGCNENSNYECTAILDRAQIIISGDPKILPSVESVNKTVAQLEGDFLLRKIYFCRRVGLPYTYIFYNYEYGFVLHYEFTSDNAKLINRYNSFQEFSQWIQSIKQWNSGKDYREEPDLPEFDKSLRLCGCPWPTNIDCVAFSYDNTPIALIEFQNAEETGVNEHYNNAFFLPKLNYKYKQYQLGEDQQRWRSQDILRLQSNLPHLTIVWSQKEDEAIVKKLEAIAYPHISEQENAVSILKQLNKFRTALKNNPHKWRNQYYEEARKQQSSSRLLYMNGKMVEIYNNPPLSFESQTFPFLYGKRYPAKTKEQFRLFFEDILSSLA